MRVLVGLAALYLAHVDAAYYVSLSGNAQGSLPSAPQGNAVAGLTIAVTTVTSSNAAGGAPVLTPSASISALPGGTYALYVPNNIATVNFALATNNQVGQIQYRFPTAPIGYLWICDPCSSTTPSMAASAGTPSGSNIPAFATGTSNYATSGTTTSCNSAGSSPGPGQNVATPQTGYNCASFTRTYSLNSLTIGTPGGYGLSALGVQAYDTQTAANAGPDDVSWSFQVWRFGPAAIVGDPQIVGMQGQDFQVHGMPDEIFNMVSSRDVQVNARFTYLESASCHDNFTACFAHPGTYISEEGIRIGRDNVRVTAGSFKKGLTVHVNGKKISESTDLKHGSIELVNHRRAVVHTNLMKITISNSDRFVNQEMQLNDNELIATGAKRVVLKDGQKFHADVPLHGLQGQTWRNVEYPSGLEYEGSIMDYHVVSGNIFGTDFVFNQFAQ